MSDAVNKPAHYNQGSIKCIEAMKIVLTPEEFRGYLKGNVFKYLWREKDKNGNEDLRKGKSYYDWLIELIDEHEQQKASDLQSLKDHPFGKLKEPAIKQSLTPEPPDGWRVLQNGELLRKGDKRWNNYISWDLEAQYIGINASNAFTTKFIRRNRFEVGEKVVHGDCKSLSISVVENILGDGWVDLVRDGVSTAYHVKDLAPYIEDAK